MRAKGGSLVVILAGVTIAWGDDGFDPPTGFYDTADGLTGAALEAALHAIIEEHTFVPYGATDEAMEVIDEAGVSPGDVELLYTDRTRAKSAFGGGSDGTGVSGQWNREHTWPRSFGIFNDGGKDNSDLFNLRPCDVDTNAERGSLFFDRTSGVPRTYPGADGSTYDNDSWEPRDDEKGDVARGCFYMAVRYDGQDPETLDLTLADQPNSGAGRFGVLSRFVEWNALDPVDDKERRRNHLIFTSYQHNRNPFIDRPAFVGRLYLDGKPEVDFDSDGLSDFWEYRFLDGLDGGPDDDGDGDGVMVLLEFALALDPGVPDAEGMPTIDRLPDGGIRFTHRMNRLAPGLRYEIQRSATLEGDAWVPADGGEATTLELSTDLRIVTVTYPDVTPTPRFFRLVVEGEGR